VTVDIERGWFYLADLNPRRGTEPGKTRPVLVVQANALNEAGHPSTIVVPITTKTVEAPLLRVRIPRGSPGFRAACDLMIDQVRAIDNRRLYRADGGGLIKRIAKAEDALLAEVETCLVVVLGLGETRAGDGRDLRVGGEGS
jgi:mRNA interferase MazF